MILNDLNLYETRTLIYIPFWQRPFFWWLCMVVGVICLFGLIGLGVYLVRKQRARHSATSFDQAVSELMLLKKSYDAHQVSVDEFYAQLSAITKKFLMQVSGDPAHSCTDAELIVFLVKRNCVADIKEDELQALLARKSAAKFGRQYVAQEIIESDYRIVGNLIKRIHEVLEAPQSSHK